MKWVSTHNRSKAMTDAQTTELRFRTMISQFVRADGEPPKVYFEQEVACGRDQAQDMARRLMQTAILRSDAAGMVRILDDSGFEIVRWNIVEEISLLASESAPADVIG
jgi:hypothetical protein